MNCYFVENKKDTSIVEKLVLVLLALCPIMQHYRGLFINASITVLLAIFPYVCVKLYSKQIIPLEHAKLLLPMILFFLYKVVDHGTTIMEAGQAIIFCILIIAISSGCFSTKFFIRVVTVVSSIASVCIIAQYISYYVLGRHIQMVPTSLFLERSNQWALGAQTGRAGITGRISKFYRPSAFFLEPSHMFIYMFMPLTLLMFAPNQSAKQKALSILISLGMLFSTSGMGILTVVALWLLYFGKARGRTRHFSLEKCFHPMSLLLYLLFIIALIIVYFKVPFFQNSIKRIVGSGNDYTNAIAGRVKSGNALVSQLRGMDLLIGVGDQLTGIKFNMSGFNETLYLYGIVGVLISYSLYFLGLLRLKNSHFWICVIIIMLSFFSIHTHSTFFMIYNAFIFMDGDRERWKYRLARELCS